jgi:uncharacterized protein (DUF2267 family)
MDFSDFTGDVQHRLELGTQGEAVRASRAVLQTLAERLHEGEATDLAGPQPMEIDWYLESAEHNQRFDWDEFVDRVGERANIEESDAVFYAQAVVALVGDIVPESELDDVRNSLPEEEFDTLFELVGQEEAFEREQ